MMYTFGPVLIMSGVPLRGLPLIPPPAPPALPAPRVEKLGAFFFIDSRNPPLPTLLLPPPLPLAPRKNEAVGDPDEDETFTLSSMGVPRRNESMMLGSMSAISAATRTSSVGSPSFIPIKRW